ncbi:hypothetical protein HQ545_03980 [Candidatus Woesearchaeota archaeon]|nr:hypothetical protein [Candidatus Woesearchaeota archaeon]
MKKVMILILALLLTGCATINDDRKNIITGDTITKLLPAKPTAFYTEEDVAELDCGVVVCLGKTLGDIYCPLNFMECREKFRACRIIKCADEFMTEEDESNNQVYDSDSKNNDSDHNYDYTIDYTTDYTTDYIETLDGETDMLKMSVCEYESHDCMDGDEKIVCRGRYEDCAHSFQECVCGTEYNSQDSVDADPDIETLSDECDTGTYICRSQQITISGEVAESAITCKSSFEECSMIYGGCECGNSTLIEFPTKTLGDGTSKYWCSHLGRIVPCYMMPDNCNKKRNTCDKGNGAWITCEGSFEYCSTKHNNRCLCGVEAISSGFMDTDSG